MKIQTSDCIKKINQKVNLAGWVYSRRDHGQLIFIDLRDRSGIIQLVFSPDKKEIHKLANTLRPEWVIIVEGRVKKRPIKMENPKVKTGKIEIDVSNLTILNKSKTPPFELTKNTKEINEETRLKYRYLDLRTDRMKENLRLRYEIVRFMRTYLDQKDFWEIETPILTKSTPEGARDYLVSSRQSLGKFYALPQSPQQFKQILMISGIEKYFQIARCFRDEDPRGDRQPEHTQLDVEMSFISQKDVMQLIEDLIIKMVLIIAPDKKITKKPFPVLTYNEAIQKYKTDRPDLRKDKKNINEFSFVWIIDFPFFEKNKEGKWTFTHNPFSAPIEEDKRKLLIGSFMDVKTTQYDLVLNGCEIGGGSIRSHKKEVIIKVFEILGYSKKEIEENFGHFLECFDYGVPPHGGIALGVDRICTIIQNESSIREVIAFPKTGDGRDLMMRAPSDVKDKQLGELGIKIAK